MAEDFRMPPMERYTIIFKHEYVSSDGTVCEPDEPLLFRAHKVLHPWPDTEEKLFYVNEFLNNFRQAVVLKMEGKA